jgi:predicted amidohydrolase YtcJ
MVRQSLRVFILPLGAAALLAQSAAPPARAQAGAAVSARLVVVNGAIYTVDPARSWASALVVVGDRITYIGDDTSARRFVQAGTRVVDLGGRMLIPAFQDSHVHPAFVPNPANDLDLVGITDRAELLARIRQFAQSHRDRPWITGSGWSEAAFLPSGQPTRELLDAAVPDRPAFLEDDSGHEGWANSRALAAAHIGAHTPDPLNGRIERTSSGRPTGVLQEYAMDLVTTAVPKPTDRELQENLQVALANMTRLGFTAIEDADATPAVADAYRALEQRGELRMRVNLCQEFDAGKPDSEQIERFLARRVSLKGPRLRANCVKMFMDGAYGSHTVALLEPYSDDSARWGRGKLFVAPERLAELVSRLDAAGMQVHMHTQGDGAVHAALDAFAEAQRRNGLSDNRHTLAHLCLISPDDIARFRSLHVIANMTPVWSVPDPWETVFAPRMFGPERVKRLYPARELLEAGAVVVWGSDWPVTGVSPLDGLETAVTHRYPGGVDPAGKEDAPLVPDEKVTLAQAIAAYTAAGAFLLHDEADRGTLGPGKLADFVVLDRNLFETPVLAIHTARVDMTVLGGDIVYERAEAGGAASRAPD